MRYILFFAFLWVSTGVNAQKINRLIKEKKVRSVLSALSSDEMMGRRPNSPGIEKAASLIAEEFRKAGLQTLDNSGTYLQSFTMISSEIDNHQVLINGQAPETADVMAFSSSETISWNNQGAEVIRIGKGENFGQRVFGELQGNKKLLIVADTTHRRIFNRLKNFRMQRFKGAGDVVVVLSPESAENYSVNIRSRLKESQLSNVVGVIPGATLKDEKVIFSAHYDHLGTGKPVDNDSIFNGANDDASGTTGVIMLARYFKKMKQPERTLVFVAFTAEESGGFGSQYFSKQMEPEQIKAMFNIEMIGTESKWGKNSAYITGYEKTDFGKILQENLNGSGFTFHPDPYTSENLFYRSDNATLARLGVPAHTISTSKMDSEKYYHTVNDEIETLDTKNMTEIIKSIAISSKGIVSGKQTPSRVSEP